MGAAQFLLEKMQSKRFVFATKEESSFSSEILHSIVSCLSCQGLRGTLGKHR